MEHRDYIPREIARETEKAYLVAVEVNNRRDGCYTRYQWVAKRICGEKIRKEFPEVGLTLEKVMVPETVIPNCIW